MQCLHCGNQFLDGLQTCPNCGAPASNMQAQNPYGQPNQNPYGQPYQNPYGQPNQNPYGQPNQFNQGQFYGQPYGQKMTKKEFLKHPNLKKCKGNINASAILLYFCAGITMIATVLLTLTVASGLGTIIDVLLLVGMGLGIQLAQSRACSIVVFIYSIINFIYGVIMTGRATGWLIVVAGICAIIYTFKFQKAWKEYEQTGMIPPAL